CRLRRVVCRGSLEQHFRQYSKLGQRGGRKAAGFSASIKSKSRLATQQTGHVI
ncbi:unnamed protein product, partial [Ascophyllum nodosum]